jgi:hypothetical protein
VGAVGQIIDLLSRNIRFALHDNIVRFKLKRAAISWHHKGSSLWRCGMQINGLGGQRSLRLLPFLFSQRLEFGFSQPCSVYEPSPAPTPRASAAACQ